jgi:enolase-phosphatase E1
VIRRLSATGVRAVLLDIEGTTTPIRYVHDVLYQFARDRLTDWIDSHAGSPELVAIAAQLTDEQAADRARGEPVPEGELSPTVEGRERLVQYVRWLMDRDRKSAGLKRLQGLVWEEGYQAGRLRGEVFPDVAPALRRWHAAGVVVAIFSSGSELAQRRLFESTAAGDLTPLLTAFFDTSVGSKREPASYERIAAALDVETGGLLFVSDIQDELHAAATAGCQAVLSIRPGNAAQPAGSPFPAVTSFDEID